MTVKGDLKLEIDEQGIEVKITITPDEKGEISPESIQAILNEKKVRSGIDNDAIDRAFRSLARKKTDPVTFVAAAGTPAQPGTGESISFEPTPIPARLEEVAARVLAKAPAPQGFRLREEKVKTERLVHKKGPLPFLPGRDQVEVVVEKRVVREDVEIDPAVTGTGFVTKGTLVARTRPGKQGKEGKSVFGRLVQAPRPPELGILFLEGLSRTGTDIKAEETGFLRRGEAWCDVVPFHDHVVDLAASPDRLTCLLTFTPGDEVAPAPDPAEVLARAAKLGFTPATLIPAEELGTLLHHAISRKAPLMARSITPAVNGLALVTISPDKLKAVLTLRKGRGGGRPLTPAAASDAIRTSRVKGFNAETVRKDLRAFFDGSASELSEYQLVEGKPPKQGSDAKITWRALFLPAEEADVLKAASRANPVDLSSLASLAAFPLDRVEALARVKDGAEVLSISPSAGSAPGVDVFGTIVPAPQVGVPEIRVYEGLTLKRDGVVTTMAGILEKGSDGMAVLLRVRAFKDAELGITVAPDRMKASVSYSPAEGAGRRIAPGDAETRLRQAGVQKGVNEEAMKRLLDAMARGTPVVNLVVAEGRRPQKEEVSRITFHVRVATGRALSLRADGRADFRAQDRITRVRRGELVATVRPRNPAAEDGWDISGATLPLPPDLQETLQAGAGIRGDLQTDGSTRFTCEAGGELIRDGAVLSVMEAHQVEGDVDLSGGNIDFPGLVRIGGNVRSGFKVVAGGPLEVGGAVEGALLSSGGTITIGQGIKGEGRAIVRARRDIESMFAEQAVLLAIGSVHLHGPCVRSQVKCNGRLQLDSEKGNLVGGEVRAGRGAELQNLGSAGGVKTVVSFGQDFLVKDQIERVNQQVAALTEKVAELDAALPGLESAGSAPVPRAKLEKARADKRTAMKLLEQLKLKLIGLHDRYDEHVDSEVVIRGTLYPGAVLECHGRRYETNTEKKMITLTFDPAKGRIVEKL